MNPFTHWADVIGAWLSRILESLCPSPVAVLDRIGTRGHGCVPLPPEPADENSLFNTGGPRSRKRTEHIQSSLFGSIDSHVGSLGAHRVGRVWALQCDGDTTQGDKERSTKGLREAALKLLQVLAFTSADEAFKQLKGVPKICLHGRPVPRGEHGEEAVCPKLDPAGFLRTALVLGKCRHGLYDPKRPVIWTENRLGQCVELHEIRQSFYRDPS